MALGAAPASAQDAADLIVRLNRVEGQMRQLSGQVEQLGYENRQLKEQLRKFQEDTEFRFQERGGGRAPAASGTRPPQKKSDAFDPSGEPNAPGAPRQLAPAGSAALPQQGQYQQGLPPQGAGPAAGGQAVASAGRDPYGVPPSGPPRRAAPAGDDDDDDAPAGGRPLDLGAAARGGRAPQAELPPGAPDPAAGGSRSPNLAAAGTGDSRADYDIAYAYLIQRQYDRAEMGFRGFLQAYPRDRLSPDATYWLGESFLQRGRHREAAEQFLKVSTDYARSAKAPDAMLKLGISLSALGAKDQACATFAEVERKYPSASTSVRQGVDREQKKARCAA